VRPLGPGRPYIRLVPHPYRNVAIVGIHNTAQARVLEGHDSRSLALEGALGAVADAGLTVSSIDGVVGEFAQDLVTDLNLGPCTRQPSGLGIPAVVAAANLVTSGECTVVALGAGGASLYTERSATAPWTRPANELVVGYGLFTAAEFALMARRHMIEFGTTMDDMAEVAAVIRNNGHHNPEAVYHGRGPFTKQDVLASRMVADPFHLLDCAMTSEGGCGLVVAAADRVADCVTEPVWILGAASDSFGPAYQMAPVWDLTGTREELPAGYVGGRAARLALRMAGIGIEEIDVAELYDPFSFEIIRQLEAFGFCGPGEGAAFVNEGNIGRGGRLPVTTDGGTMSFSHPGISAQQIQRVIRGVQQLRRQCATAQVDGAGIALCSNGGSGALFTDVMLLGRERP
jgi:acetyl-CoA acetyltransferase